MNDIQRLIYGKNNIQRIVSCEISNDLVELFVQQPDGTILSDIRPNKYWMLAHNKLDHGFEPLEGNLFYKHIKLYDDKAKFLVERKIYYRDNTFSVWNDKEAAMLYRGFTYYKGLTPSDITVLSFDIESTTLEHNEDAKVLIIANTLRHNNVVTRKMFCYDEYANQKDLIDAWTAWVREVNPSIVCGHNIVIFDLRYLDFIAKREGTELILGRDDSSIVFEDRESKFRKDGSQSYSYNKVSIYGREIVDTFFLSVKWDSGRKLQNYKLKNIIKELGLEVHNRQFYDGELIRVNYIIPDEWYKIKEYARFDADDSLNIFDKMSPAFFFMTQTVPKTFQQVIEGASGSQLNAMMIRSYLQENHSLPISSNSVEYEGGLSFGLPGNYKNTLKFDIISEYPSVIKEYRVYDRNKDPKGNFLKLTDYFFDTRIEYKNKYKETGDEYFNNLQAAFKILLNSLYGLLGAQGLLFNSPLLAAFVTKKGREMLQIVIQWATGKPYEELAINE